METLDVSYMLRNIMAARNLTVSEMAAMAGVSKSAMEKYLAGPSSPRAVAIASLAKALDISADTILFGEIDANVELAFDHAFKAFVALLNDLKEDEQLLSKFMESEAGSADFSRFSHELAFERAKLFRKAFQANSRDFKITAL